MSDLGLTLSAEEREHILKRRQERAARAAWRSGVLSAVAVIEGWGNECCGGRGREKDDDGQFLGEPYYGIAKMLDEWLERNRGDDR